MDKKLKVFVVIETMPCALGSEGGDKILGLFYLKENAKEAVEKNKKKYESWAGKCSIKKYKIKWKILLERVNKKQDKLWQYGVKNLPKKKVGIGFMVIDLNPVLSVKREKNYVL